MILDGLALSKRKKEDFIKRADSFSRKSGRAPCLHVVLVGADPASQVYVGRKEKFCKSVGVMSKMHRLGESTSEGELKSLIESLNGDDSVDGLLVQLPLPKKLQNFDPLMLIDPKKDVDGLSPFNMGLMIKGEAYAEPCTPKGIISLLKANNIKLEGLRACVVGRSETVGWPMAWMLTRENATVTVCHSKTERLEECLKEADLVVAAAGRREFIAAESLKEGAIVVDVGIHRLPGGGLVGDVKTEGLKEKKITWSPVPGGVGPMTVCTLVENLLSLVEDVI